MAFGVYFVESMLPGHIIWHANKLENCLPWSLLVIQSFVPIPMCQSYFDHYIIYPCFVSINEGYINAFLQQILSCRLQHIIREWDLETCQSCGTLEAIFIIDGFPRGCWWFTLLAINQSISLMFDFKTIYSHEIKCTGSVTSKTLGC